MSIIKHRLISFVLASVLLCLPLTSCSTQETAVDTVSSESASIASSVEEEQPAPVEEAASSTAEEEEQPVQLSEEEQKAAQEKFREVFDQMPLVDEYDGEYDGCIRFTVVSDYDGNGSLEAFGFVGTPSDWQPAPYWECISIYYIDSEYNITPLIGGTTNYDTVNGSICCPEPYMEEDFSNCVYTSGNEHFLAWRVAYWEGDYFSLILGVKDGKPEQSYLYYFFVNEEGQFAGYDENDNEIPVQFKDGRMTNA